MNNFSGDRVKLYSHQFEENLACGFGEVKKCQNTHKIRKQIVTKLQRHLLNKLRSRDLEKCPYANFKQMAKRIQLKIVLNIFTKNYLKIH